MPLSDAIRLHAFVPKIAIMTMILDHGPRELEKRSVDTSSAVIQYQQGSAGISTSSRDTIFAAHACRRCAVATFRTGSRRTRMKLVS
jgi:hypothetical protein